MKVDPNKLVVIGPKDNSCISNIKEIEDYINQFTEYNEELIEILERMVLILEAKADSIKNKNELVDFIKNKLTEFKIQDETVDIERLFMIVELSDTNIEYFDQIMKNHIESNSEFSIREIDFLEGFCLAALNNIDYLGNMEQSILGSLRSYMDDLYKEYIDVIGGVSSKELSRQEIYLCKKYSDVVDLIIEEQEEVEEDLNNTKVLELNNKNNHGVANTVIVLELSIITMYILGFIYYIK